MEWVFQDREWLIKNFIVNFVGSDSVLTTHVCERGTPRFVGFTTLDEDTPIIGLVQDCLDGRLFINIKKIWRKGEGAYRLKQFLKYHNAEALYHVKKKEKIPIDKIDEHLLEGMSYYEAQAFCGWDTILLADGKRVFIFTTKLLAPVERVKEKKTVVFFNDVNNTNPISGTFLMDKNEFYSYRIDLDEHYDSLHIMIVKRGVQNEQDE
jgi:hypothetical protein